VAAEARLTPMQTIVIALEFVVIPICAIVVAFILFRRPRGRK
jgi:hypothetical protein